ncbi:hypothetical protein A3H65_02250 [Candidatus Giovannonibacteria bacterium RIFCSPLOWO2_02_FULL_45_14]|uniref:Uncharacterized protein n=1 Tax=Candidatus Giovannonibacteria bacterium RIFCSPLOWO2_12_FULL_44_15 TaxID=1798364 RepID=A0A1F5Y101_9BACT|nr:MAG: hypothetical protein A3C75_03040 [Candidatus Giovannonibacteria bacterium RIFCSPHIGHO2_02_FULL_44_31]OGF76743.1 MAG: hypothetical protein A3E62_02975 [Candidatus Giovannonibacteria bacterium RIFCSPHIGHO2_12_FULL_44_29]OGF90727.1 MAG: hypothetical protein A3H65_02250 [Candidatus Giovannonibacteria bacterium RIFCSPLOWO2_02_FULL_45_14]OGF93824.1 MAG: hypothetical protein A3G54_02400 [Candidatus Giovannonibacteria bacterium RIFCSPLOWO2_12_FULL_44_15]
MPKVFGFPQLNTGHVLETFSKPFSFVEKRHFYFPTRNEDQSSRRKAGVLIPVPIGPGDLSKGRIQNFIGAKLNQKIIC